jgi:hypothetical protein
MHAEKSATATATPKPGCQSSADHWRSPKIYGLLKMVVILWLILFPTSWRHANHSSICLCILKITSQKSHRCWSTVSFFLPHVELKSVFIPRSATLWPWGRDLDSGLHTEYHRKSRCAAAHQWPPGLSARRAGCWQSRAAMSRPESSRELILPPQDSKDIFRCCKTLQVMLNTILYQ